MHVFLEEALEYSLMPMTISGSLMALLVCFSLFFFFLIIKTNVALSGLVKIDNKTKDMEIVSQVADGKRINFADVCPLFFFSQTLWQRKQ